VRLGSIAAAAAGVDPADVSITGQAHHIWATVGAIAEQHDWSLITATLETHASFSTRNACMASPQETMLRKQRPKMRNKG
jgi:hypothetical protein